jgi:DNA-binding response OmpR family regulator
MQGNGESGRNCRIANKLWSHRGMILKHFIPMKSTRHNRIYIVEDDKPLSDDLRTVLTENGFDVQVFQNGYPVVAMIDNWPDVFLIDIELPGINGLEICKWLKSHEGSQDIPVIFLSGDSYLKVLAASAHPDDYIEKRVAREEVIARVSDLLQVAK